MPDINIRTFPDVAQASISTITTVDDSKVTFSGKEGMVDVEYRVTVKNDSGAAAVPHITLGLTGTAPLTHAISGHGWFEAVGGLFFTLYARALVKNPKPTSFIEAQLTASAGLIEIDQDGGAVLTVSYSAEDTGGPIATVDA